MEQKIKVLHISPSLSGGGIPTTILSWHRNIECDKIHFDFITFADRGSKEFFTDEVLDYGSKIYYLEGKKNNKRISLVKTFVNLRKILKNNKYDIVHSHLNGFSVVTLLAAMLSGVKVRIAHSHVSYNNLSLNKRIKKKILNIGFKCVATCYCACSKDAGRYLFGDNFVDENKVHIINNGIDTRKFAYDSHVRDNYRDIFNLRDNFVIGHVGRFDASKNHNFLIDIFYEIHKKNKDARLILVGDGEFKSKIQAKVNDLGIGDFVIFLGVRKDVEKLLQMFDIFVFPSYYEGFGIAILEAQAAGLRTFVSDYIPREVKVTNLVQFVSLNKNARYWANKIIECNTNYNRKNTYILIEEVGYDLKSSATHIRNLYYNELKGSKYQS